MRILITNDDGIASPCLVPLARWAKKLGEVTIIAPKYEQSGRSHAIDFFKKIEIKRVDLAPDVEAYSVDSTPADCVRYGVLGRKEKYDLVISGINKGFNLGKDIVYSGTAGAIFEAARLDIKGLAISTDPKTFDIAMKQLDVVYDYFVKHRLFEENDLYNVNIPLENNGIKITRQGGIYFTDEFVSLGNDIYVQKGSIIDYGTRELDIDIDAVTHGYISITPLLATRTNNSVFEKLKNL